MKRKKIDIIFNHLKHDELVSLAHHIMETMSKNSDVFLSPTPNFAVLAKFIDVFDEAAEKTDYEGMTREIFEARRAVESGLKYLGDYVNNLAEGDMEILEKSGFPFLKPPTPQGVIPAPTKMGMNAVRDGFEVWAMIATRAYYGVIFAYTEATNPEDDPKKWMFHYSPIPSATIREGLENGQEYKVAIAFLGESEELDFGIVEGTVCPG